MHTIKPIDKDIIIKSAKETKKIITIEDHSIIGGIGTAIADVLVEKYPAKLTKIGVKDTFGKSGKADELVKYFGLDSESIIKVVKENNYKYVLRIGDNAITTIDLILAKLGGAKILALRSTNASASSKKNLIINKCFNTII